MKIKQELGGLREQMTKSRSDQTSLRQFADISFMTGCLWGKCPIYFVEVSNILGKHKFCI